MAAHATPDPARGGARHLRLFDWGPSPCCMKVRAILDYRAIACERDGVLRLPASAVLLRDCAELATYMERIKFLRSAP